ncbi:MAG: hypothetical protein ABIJ65_03250 [Chloroflexota bacterium]
MSRYLLLVIFLLSACQPVRHAESGFDVQYHPEGGLYVGDRVSIEVAPPPDWDTGEQQVRVTLGEQVLGTEDFLPSGVGQREQATFWWVWDTTDLEAGELILSFDILPDGQSWQDRVELQSADERPYPKAAWETTTSDCCTLAYITGTDAERDIELLKNLVDDQAENVRQRMQTDIEPPISITFIPRLLGQGGFASNGIYVTYLDDNYAGNSTSQVIHHEMVHIFDRNLGGKLLPTMLVEGLAVYMSGGHFKIEALLSRAAALLEMGSYIPLGTLAENFYYQQHEIGYLEAGALVEYMVGRFGWDEYQSFYRDIDAVGDQAESLEAGLNKHFDISLEQLEKDFLNVLEQQDVTESVINDLKITVEFYDSLRLYQETLDPSAYFLTAWFPDGDTMQQEGIVADFLRGPNRMDNHFFEFLLRTASHNVSAGDQKQAEMILEWVNFLLSLYPR